MKKTTAKAPANIAFIKYWGKKNPKLRLPLSNSVSMNLSNVFTTTTVEFSPQLKKDQIIMDKEHLSIDEAERIIKHLDLIREKAKIPFKAKVKTKNNFPKGTGTSSSASGFAALTLAGCKAAGLNLNEKELSIIARLGSGSACRSIPDGFVEWQKGNSSKTSFAKTIYLTKYWQLADIVVIVSQEKKKISSSQGHAKAESSPFLNQRIENLPKKIKRLKLALKAKNFSTLGQIIEEEAINMHAVMMTSSPAIFYWLPKTLEIILAIKEWRDQGLESYFTIDAGPIVHIICEKKDVLKIKSKLSQIVEIQKTIVNYPSQGAHLVKSHLF